MSCPSSAILESSKLNIEGILKLQQGNNWEAIWSFNDGLRRVLAALQAVSASDEQHMSASASLRDILFSVNLCQRTETYTTIANSGTADCRFAIYCRALHLSLDNVPCKSTSNDETSLSTVPVAYYHLVCGVLLYNIGLAYHLIALENGCSKLLEKTLEFYSVAHRTLCQSNISQQTRSELQELGTLAFLALANNVGHIHAVLFNQTETKICGDAILNRLSSLLGPVKSSSNTGPIDYDAILDEAKDYREFMLNASFFLGTDLMPAPAA
jgi:hypothetical protein